VRRPALIAVAVALAASGTAHADVALTVWSAPGVPAAGLTLHTFGADGELVEMASTEVPADGVYRVSSAALGGVPFPLQVRLDPRLDACTGQTVAPVATVAADGSSGTLDAGLTPFCAAPAALEPADRLTVGADGVGGASGGSVDLLALTPAFPAGGTVAVTTEGGETLATVTADPRALYARFRLQTPAAAYRGDVLLRWTIGGVAGTARLTALDVQPEQPVQAPLGAGAVHVSLVVDGSPAAAGVDPGGRRRGDAARLLRLLVGRPLGGFAGTLAGPFDYDVALRRAAESLGRLGQPRVPKVVVLLTASDANGPYGGAHADLAHTAAGHRWPVVVVPLAPPVATSLVAARIARETGGFLLPADGADDAAANVLEAWARLHGGRRTLRSAVSATGRRPSVTVVRGLPGRPLRVLVGASRARVAVGVTDPAGRPVAVRPYGSGVVAVVPRARAGAYRVTVRVAGATGPFAYARGELVTTVG
jgi:hypothetical protein